MNKTSKDTENNGLSKDLNFSLIENFMIKQLTVSEMLNYQSFNRFQKLSSSLIMLVMKLKQLNKDSSFIQRLVLFLKNIEENTKRQNVTI